MSKARPEKPSNGVEENTELTINTVSDGAPTCQKRFGVAKGGSGNGKPYMGVALTHFSILPLC
ncbi:TPA: hypothetical protein RG647_RS11140 [Providencia rettgeri]|uniref:hypothetical protein n=1 Tax=Proteus penneri TaxID=102862 RepID=UPI0015E7E678|nr:hypothetical protein [Proteus penneri]HEC8328914.1 hypothetical protein [Providencia rettgeri]